MYRYFDNTETPKDNTFQKIMEQLDGFMEHLPTEEDRHLFSNMVSECYDKHYEAIKSMEGDDPRLITPLVMALFVDQQLMIDRLQVNNC
jgi:hypothetical protein